MIQADRKAVLGAAAKSLAWQLYSAAEYGRARATVNVDRFERELFSAFRQWKRTRNNLNTGKENT